MTEVIDFFKITIGICKFMQLTTFCKYIGVIVLAHPTFALDQPGRRGHVLRRFHGGFHGASFYSNIVPITWSQLLENIAVVGRHKC